MVKEGLSVGVGVVGRSAGGDGITLRREEHASKERVSDRVMLKRGMFGRENSGDASDEQDGMYVKEDMKVSWLEVNW